MGLFRKESGSNGSSEGDGDVGFGGRIVPGVSVSSSPPITGLGRKVSESVATP